MYHRSCLRWMNFLRCIEKVAARRIIAGKWGCNNGQACVSPDYVVTTKEFSPNLVRKNFQFQVVCERDLCYFFTIMAFVVDKYFEI